VKESELYQKHVRKMSGLLHLERIESSVGTGFPDVSAAGGGKQFLIETKVAKPVDKDDFLYFERFQLSFYQKRLRYTKGGGIFIIAFCPQDETIKTWEASAILDAQREPYKKWNRIKVYNISRPIFSLVKPWSKFDMQSLGALMIEKTQPC